MNTQNLKTWLAGHWVAVTIVGIKFLLAFYTVPENALAMGIESFLDVRVLGLAVYELTFILCGIMLGHGLVAGNVQTVATWGAFITAMIIMGSNAVVANLLHAGQPLGMWATYRFSVLPYTPMILVAMLAVVGATSPALILKSREQSQLLKMKLLEQAAELDAAKAAANLQATKRASEAAKSDSEAFGLTLKITTDKQRQKTLAAIERAKMLAEQKIGIASAKEEAHILEVIATAEQSALKAHVDGQEFKKEIGELAQGKIRSHLNKAKREKLGN